MINIDISTNPNLYVNYLEGLSFLKNIKDEDYKYPNEIVNFHVYTEVRNEKELDCIKSYFATQNIEKTKLIIWSDYDISNQENLKEYAELIDFRVYNPVEEAKGTILENKLEILTATDMKHYLQSDLLRILALHKYGGIWIDMDILLLRDFKPILDQEFLYQWGGDIDFENQGCCGTVMSLKKNSELSTLLLTEILSSPIIGGTTIWGKDLFARVYRKTKYTIFPSTFFNTEWLMSKINEPLSNEILEMWFEKECPDDLLFTEAFAWHWHNSSNKNKTINENSKFYKLSCIIGEKIKMIQNELG